MALARRVGLIVLLLPMLGAKTPSRPDQAWAISYLLNTTLAAEFYSVAVLDESSEDLGKLWERAGFAMHSAAEKGQRLMFADKARPLWVKVGTRGATTNAAWKQALAGDATIFHAATDASFVGKRKAFWNALQGSFQAPNPKCPLNATVVSEIAKHLRQATADNKTPSDQAILTPLQGWDPKKVRCLIFAMTASSEELQAAGGFDPLPLLQALKRNDPVFAKDLAMNLILAVRYMHAGQYSETLRILYDAQQDHPALRLAYDLVQRIYSYRQKGQGKVALQGL